MVIASPVVGVFWNTLTNNLKAGFPCLPLGVLLASLLEGAPSLSVLQLHLNYKYLNTQLYIICF